LGMGIGRLSLCSLGDELSLAWSSEGGREVGREGAR
jgi:hypothetical protein